MRFWDSSALVPLVVQQKASATAEAWHAEDGEIVIWTLTDIEIISALRRLWRDGDLDDRDALRAEQLASELASHTHVVADLEGVKSRARRLLRIHALRAGDALQLAAALHWVDGLTDGQVLHTFDHRLAFAARAEGFRVLPE
jgi:predicted nucleic acid-binding protein